MKARPRQSRSSHSRARLAAVSPWPNRHRFRRPLLLIDKLDRQVLRQPTQVTRASTPAAAVTACMTLAVAE